MWDTRHLDLFATCLNHQLSPNVSPVPDPLAFQLDALLMNWTGLFTYAIPPWSLLDKASTQRSTMDRHTVHQSQLPGICLTENASFWIY